MPDDLPPPPDLPETPQPPEEEPNEEAASDIFLELMRQAAEKRTRLPQAIRQPLPSTDEESDEIEDTTLEIDASVNIGERGELPEFLQRAKQIDEVQVDQPEESPLDEERVPFDPKQYRAERRLQNRQRRRENRIGATSALLRTLIMVGFTAAIVGTVFTWFTDPSQLNAQVIAEISNPTPVATQAPTLYPTPNFLRRIGIVAGHQGPENDPGAVCPDGLTESEITFSVAEKIVQRLRDAGYSVDLLDEFDPRLQSYEASALVSVHANTCQRFDRIVSGYMVARAAVRQQGGVDDELAECIALRYEAATKLVRNYNLTEDMTDYHTFREIHPFTPAAIIELGFMLADRELLLEQQDLIADAIINGIECYLNQEVVWDFALTDTPTPTITPLPSPTPEPTSET